MTYTHLDAQWELNQEFLQALESDDLDFIQSVADKLKNAGEDEDAEVLMHIIKRDHADGMAYDVANDR